jgi:hypothetical protein
MSTGIARQLSSKSTEAQMGSAVDQAGNTPEIPALLGKPVSDAVRSTLDNWRSPNAAAQPEALSGPAVLAQRPAVQTSDAAARMRPHRVETPHSEAAPEDTVAMGIFTSTQHALSTGYRSISSSTDAFAHESPWKAVSFAVLGGVIAGMLIAR